MYKTYSPLSLLKKGLTLTLIFPLNFLLNTSIAVAMDLSSDKMFPSAVARKSRKSEEISAAATASAAPAAANNASSVSEEKGKKGSNKESFNLLRENFSQNATIDFEGIYGHIGYTFKQPQLLIDALSPLLPKPLKSPSKKFDQLEFLGDAALALVIRRHLTLLFPEETVGMHEELYQALTCNMTLSEKYQSTLISIEKHLPYPGYKTCKYCNIVEALIGAITLDEYPKVEATRTFVMRVLDDHILLAKWQESKRAQGNDRSALVVPSIKETISHLLLVYPPDTANPKSFLGMLLGKVLKDQPTYRCSLGKDADGKPVFVSHVTGAQIGHVLTGSGITRAEAEENTASVAINFLAHQELFPQKKSAPSSYTKFVHEYCQSQNLRLSFREGPPPHPSFMFQIKQTEVLIGEGIGASKAEAKEKAAQAASQYFRERNRVQAADLDEKKSYQSLLQEWKDQQKIEPWVYVENKEHSQIVFEHYVDIEGGIETHGRGASKEAAREQACALAFEHLLSKQEETVAQQAKLRELGKKRGPQGAAAGKS